MTKGRLGYLDVVKGIGIYLMVLCHAGLSNMFTAWVYAFHMPLFFILSGYCYAKYPPPDSIVQISFILKKTKQILVPYFLFSLIYCFGGNGLKDWVFIIYASRQSLSLAQSCTPLWFLPAFFLSVVFYRTLLVMIVNIKIRLIICVLSSILGFYLSSLDSFNTLGFPFSFDIALVGVLLMEFGALLKIITSSKTTLISPIALLFFGIIACITFKMNLPESLTPDNPHVEMAVGSYGQPLWFLFNAFSISGLIFIVSGRIVTVPIISKVLQYYGRNTLAVLCIHPIVLMILLGGIQHAPIYLHDIESSIVKIFIPVIVSIIAMILIVPVLRMLNVFIPNMVGKNNS